MTWTTSFYYVSLYLACFVVSIYVIFIWVIWILKAYVQQQMGSYLFTRLQKILSSCGEPKEEWPHAGLYKYNGRQIELFQMNGLMVDRLTGSRLMSLWSAWGWC